MRRLLVLTAAILVAVAAGGCGVGGSGSGAPGAPEPNELAREAFRAAAAAGSVRYNISASMTAEGQAPMSFSVDGAVGRKEATADVRFSGEGQSLAGTLLYDRGGFFVRFLGRWYGEKMPPSQAQQLERELGTEDGFAAHFDDVLEGSVDEGPVADGVPTWAYNGRLNVDGILDLMAQEAPLDDDDREQVEKLADSTRFTFLVGKVDGLPRAFQLDMSGEGIDFGGFADEGAGELVITLRGSFSGWGEPVRVTAPGAYAPLEELYRQFFGF